MTHLELAPGIDELVAARIVKPVVARLQGAVRDGARAAAPPTKTWHTMGDDRVRPWHRPADGQEVPGNLRFAIPHSPRKDVRHYPGVEMLRYPRDPTAYYLQTQDCRCFTSQDPHGISRHIRSEEVFVEGARVVGNVACDAHRAAEAEHGTAEDQGAWFMRRGLADAQHRMA